MADPKKVYVPPTGGLGPPIPRVTPGAELPELPDLRVFPNQPNPRDHTKPEVSPQEEAFSESLEEPKTSGKWTRIPGVGLQMEDGTIVTDEGNIIQPNVDTEGGRVHGMVLPSERQHPRISPPETLEGTPSPAPGASKSEDTPVGPPQQPYTPGGMAMPSAAGAIPGGPISAPYRVGVSGGGSGFARPPFDAMDTEDKKYAEKIGDYQGALSSAQSAETDRAIGTNEHVRETVSSLADLQKLQSDFRQKSMDEVKVIDARNQKLAETAAAEKIDPEHYWNTKGTGTKIAMALSMALGEFGSHMPHVSGGGQNLASQLIQSAIQRDVEAQKDNIANKWKAVSTGTDLVKNKIAEGNFVADQMDKEALLAQHKLTIQLTGLQAVTDSADKKAKLAAMIADAQNQSRQIQEGMVMRRYQYSMSLLAGQAAQIQAQRKAYEELKVKLYEKNAESRAKGETEAEIPSFGQFQGTTYTGKGGGSTAGAIPERDRGDANKELALAGDAKELQALGSKVNSTAWDPRRVSQYTDAGKQALVNEQYNAKVDILAKKVDTLRMSDEQKADARSRLESIKIAPGDSDEFVLMKKRAAPGIIGVLNTPILSKYGAAPPAPQKDYGKVVQPAGK